MRRPTRVHIFKAACGNSLKFNTEGGVSLRTCLSVLSPGGLRWSVGYVLCRTCEDMITPIEHLHNTEI